MADKHDSPEKKLSSKEVVMRSKESKHNEKNGNGKDAISPMMKNKEAMIQQRMHERMLKKQQQQQEQQKSNSNVQNNNNKQHSPAAPPPVMPAMDPSRYAY
jgi:hypothetical protein